MSHGETILVVEDDLGLRTMVGILLRSHGYRLLETSHAVEAESLVRHCIDPIHLVLMDVTLPGVNGYDLARILLDIRPFPAMLFISGYEEDYLALDRTVCVKSEFLLKPFGLNVLITKIQETIGNCLPRMIHEGLLRLSSFPPQDSDPEALYQRIWSGFLITSFCLDLRHHTLLV